MKIAGRNDPCPCGSGKKYKKCCLPMAQAARQSEPNIDPGELPEGQFIVELRPDLEKEIDQLLRWAEAGKGKRLRTRFEALLDRHPEYHLTHYAMGVYLGQVEGDPRSAIPFFERAVRIYPPFVEAHYNLGCANCSIGHVAAAVAAFRKAIRYSDGEDGIDIKAREQLQRMEEILLAHSPFKSLEAYIENQNLFDLAFENLKTRNHARAVELFEKVLQQNPKHVQSHGNMALAKAALGQKDAALKCLDKALELDPSYEPAINNRKIIKEMTEGQPAPPWTIAETEYYLERLEEQKAERQSLWQKVKQQMSRGRVPAG